MRAWVIHRNGEPKDVLQLEEIPEPVPGPGELGVDVEAVGAIFPDVLLVRGEYQIKLPLPAVPGGELVGRVRSSGEGTTIEVGSRIIATTRPTHGAFAQHTVVAEPHATVVPEELPAATAVCLPTNYVTAYLALHTRARIQPGETVLVHGGAGGVGTAAVQIALAAGARVIATDFGDERLQLCRDLGADLAVDPRSDDLVAAVQQWSGGHGVDVVIDTVGGEAFTASRRCIAFEGRIVVVGFTSGDIPELRVNQLILRNFAVMGVNAMAYLWEHNPVAQHARRAVIDLCVQGKIAPAVYGEFRFEETPEVLTRLASGQVLGKAVVRVA